MPKGGRRAPIAGWTALGIGLNAWPKIEEAGHSRSELSPPPPGYIFGGGRWLGGGEDGGYARVIEMGRGSGFPLTPIFRPINPGVQLEGIVATLSNFLAEGHGRAFPTAIGCEDGRNGGRFLSFAFSLTECISPPNNNGARISPPPPIVKHGTAGANCRGQRQ